MSDDPKQTDRGEFSAVPERPSEIASASLAHDAADESEPHDAPAAESSPTSAGDGTGAGSEPARQPPDPAKQRQRPRNPTLVRAFRTGRPVEGTVAAVIKGGYEIKIGKSRGFCPHSQMDLHRENDPEGQIGKAHLFRVTQVRRGGEDVVLSRRVLLEEQRSEEAKAVRATLIEGAVMQGHVSGTAPFGAFVDLGAGVMGLVHISELSHNRVKRVEDAVRPGSTVQVKILKVNEAQGRISLSIRQAAADPWIEAASRFNVGAVYPGTVVRLATFGAFVELAPGIEALAPASEFPPTRLGWQAGLEPGVSHEWQVLSVEASQRRISLALPGEGPVQGPLAVDSCFTGQVQRVENYGVFVWLGPGSVGLMPRAWTGLPPGKELQRSFEVGQAVAVRVVEIAEGGRKIRLAAQGVSTQPEERPSRPAPPVRPVAEERRAPQPPRPAPEKPPTFGTSLADKLRAALGQTGPGSGAD